jgi:hypothetical protein
VGGRSIPGAKRRDVRDAAPLLVEPLVGEKHGVVNVLHHTCQWRRARSRASRARRRAGRARRLRADVSHAEEALRDGHLVIVYALLRDPLDLVERGERGLLLDTRERLITLVIN